mmetsp:Transcript_13322/g.23854  ORF Transcript_13322/g.23854 Transcript_13322/m.23854 type:complete len:105 (-) Transcript_13322:14-328(-)
MASGALDTLDTIRVELLDVTCDSDVPSRSQVESGGEDVKDKHRGVAPEASPRTRLLPAGRGRVDCLSAESFAKAISAVKQRQQQQLHNLDSSSEGAESGSESEH